MDQQEKLPNAEFLFQNLINSRLYTIQFQKSGHTDVPLTFLSDKCLTVCYRCQ